MLIFIPSVDQEGEEIDQGLWRDTALTVMAGLFRGATALPPGRGAWRDSGGNVLLEDTALVFSIADPVDVTAESLGALGDFARRLGRETNQGEVGVIVENYYHPITDYSEGTSNE